MIGALKPVEANSRLGDCTTAGRANQSFDEKVEQSFPPSPLSEYTLFRVASGNLRQLSEPWEPGLML